jgi:hypothetical protein
MAAAQRGCRVAAGAQLPLKTSLYKPLSPVEYPKTAAQKTATTWVFRVLAGKTLKS